VHVVAEVVDAAVQTIPVAVVDIAEHILKLHTCDTVRFHKPSSQPSNDPKHTKSLAQKG